MTKDSVKLALRITTNAFDSEIEALMSSAVADLGIVLDDKTKLVDTNPLVSMAIITYCKANFGQPDDYDRLKASYDEQKAQIRSCGTFRS